MNFAQKLKEMMDKKSITGYRLAKELGVHQTTIKNWLDGKGEPRISEVANIARILDVDIRDLAGFPMKFLTIEDYESLTDNDELNQRQDVDERISGFYGLDALEVLTLYLSLDDGDKGEIRGTMRQMLKAAKYSSEV